jgi:hypothetical protein
MNIHDYFDYFARDLARDPARDNSRQLRFGFS